MPWLRAPSRTRNGNRPLPAIRPHPAVLVSALAMNAYRLALLHDSAFRRLDEANQLLHVFRIAQRFAHFRERLAGVHLRAQQRSEEHTSELQSQFHLVCRLLLEKKKKKQFMIIIIKKKKKNI